MGVHFTVLTFFLHHNSALSAGDDKLRVKKILYYLYRKKKKNIFREFFIWMTGLLCGHFAKILTHCLLPTVEEAVAELNPHSVFCN